MTTQRGYQSIILAEERRPYLKQKLQEYKGRDADLDTEAKILVLTDLLNEGRVHLSFLLNCANERGIPEYEACKAFGIMQKYNSGDLHGLTGGTGLPSNDPDIDTTPGINIASEEFFGKIESMLSSLPSWGDVLTHPTKRTMLQVIVHDTKKLMQKDVLRQAVQEDLEKKNTFLPKGAAKLCFHEATFELTWKELVALWRKDQDKYKY